MRILFLKLPYIRYFSKKSCLFLILNINVFCLKPFLVFSFMCRTYVCGFFHYTYIGVNKDTGKELNNWFITFIPFLGSLTLELSEALSSICLLESSSKLLFQQCKEDLIKVLSICLTILPLHLWHAYVFFPSLL